MEKKTWAVVCICTHIDMGKVANHINLDFVDATSKAEAEGIFYEWIFSEFPQDKGYTSHSCLAKPCPYQLSLTS